MNPRISDHIAFFIRLLIWLATIWIVAVPLRARVEASSWEYFALSFAILVGGLLAGLAVGRMMERPRRH
ncbi:hypothetical protein [Arenimonas aestuarii]